MTLPGVVLVGARGYGLHHRANIDRLVAAGVCTVTAVVDPALGTTADAGVPVVADVAAARRLGPVDVVVVAAPIAAHLPLTLDALDAGADVLLEKPPVTTRDALDVLLEAERRTGRVVQVGFQSLGSAALPAFRDGALVGAVRSAAAVGTWTRDRAYWDRSPWAGRRRVGGVDVLDGVVTNPLAHAVATALALVGCRRTADVARVEVRVVPGERHRGRRHLGRPGDHDRRPRGHCRAHALCHHRGPADRAGAGRDGGRRTALHDGRRHDRRRDHPPGAHRPAREPAGAPVPRR
ncbi:Gfo/Idh/MocA family oxidoreductase [Curtobacterium flaccumfaciens]|nr:Gfo/Idh/MocA family oxidoreductase [Curtobacterium flaccumfaciens]